MRKTIILLLTALMLTGPLTACIWMDGDGRGGGYHHEHRHEHGGGYWRDRDGYYGR